MQLKKLLQIEYVDCSKTTKAEFTGMKRMNTAESFHDWHLSLSKGTVDNVLILICKQLAESPTKLQSINMLHMEKASCRKTVDLSNTGIAILLV